jgi:hypothetical protein
VFLRRPVCSHLLSWLTSQLSRRRCWGADAPNADAPDAPPGAKIPASLKVTPDIRANDVVRILSGLDRSAVELHAPYEAACAAVHVLG